MSATTRHVDDSPGHKGTLPYAHALVTGASAGIGEALARRLVREGVGELTLVARREDRIRAVADSLPCKTRIVAADLASDAGVAAVIAACPAVDLLVNNAGVGGFGAFHDADPHAIDKMVRLNCLAPVRLASHLLPGMVARGHGAVLNVASGQSFQPVPYMSTYAASKAFLLHWAEGVREELSGTGVRVVTVCPGATPTEFNAASGVPDADLRVMGLVSNTLDGVVEACVVALRSDRGVTVPGLGNWLLTTIGGLGPRVVGRKVVAAVLRPVAQRLTIQRPAE